MQKGLPCASVMFMITLMPYDNNRKGTFVSAGDLILLVSEQLITSYDKSMIHGHTF